MKQPIFVRSLTKEERLPIEAGLRSSDALVLRRSQILLVSARGERAPRIARALSCNEQTVRNAIHAFNQKGRGALRADSHRPHRLRTTLGDVDVDTWKRLLHRPPRDFGFETSLWTLDLAALLCVKQGWTDKQVSNETIRQTLKRAGINWKRAKHWITSPDPLYFKKNGTRPLDRLGEYPARLGHWFFG